MITTKLYEKSVTQAAMLLCQPANVTKEHVTWLYAN